jgi:hypothetical protein
MYFTKRCYILVPSGSPETLPPAGSLRGAGKPLGHLLFLLKWEYRRKLFVCVLYDYREQHMSSPVVAFLVVERERFGQKSSVYWNFVS